MAEEADQGPTSRTAWNCDVITRASAVAALAANRFDVVVAGGGITGAGVAFDAACRGLSVGLVERGDFASGTSSRSTKLLHGGLRYVPGLHLGLVRQSLHERELLLRLAPRLVSRLPIVLPTLAGPRPSRRLGVALSVYDLLALDGRTAAARHRTVSGDEVIKLVPALAARAPGSGFLYHDCQVDDARLVLTVLAEAERRGAVCANRLEAEGLVRKSGRIVGVRVRDAEGGSTFEIACNGVVNATGVWANWALRNELHRNGGSPVLRPSRGTHIILRRDDLPLDRAGVVIPSGRGRHVSVLPWMHGVLIGATDDDCEGEPDDVRPEVEDVDYLLKAVNNCFGTRLARGHVAGAFAGVRPLVAGRRRESSADVVRRAALHESPSGLITITGGKLTTWRRMAKRAVDLIVRSQGRGARCRTDEISLGQLQDPRELPHTDGVPAPAYSHLAARYGPDAVEVLAIAASDPFLARPILSGHPDLIAEAAFAARHEQARSVGDVLLRRTRLGILAAREICAPATDVARQVAEAMAPDLGWDDRRTRDQVAAWDAEARAEGIVVPGAIEPTKRPVTVR